MHRPNDISAPSALLIRHIDVHTCLAVATACPAGIYPTRHIRTDHNRSAGLCGFMTYGVQHQKTAFDVDVKQIPRPVCVYATDPHVHTCIG